MTPDIERQFFHNVANAPIRPHPYAHVYVPDVFPADFYARLQENIPDPAAMRPISEVRSVEGYKERFVLDLGSEKEGLTASQGRFWGDLSDALLSGRFRDLLLTKFEAFIRERFPDQPTLDVEDETLLVEDLTNYALGPHTDTPAKVITVIFYLPRDDSLAHLGTSIYTPRNPARRCEGGPHYPYESFDRFATMPFVPNSMFAFVKNDRSFHGVEPVTDPDVRRWLLLYDVRLKNPPPSKVRVVAPPPGFF